MRKVRYFSTPPILSRLGASSSGTCLHRYNHLPQDQSTLFPVINPHLDNIHLPMAGIGKADNASSLCERSPQLPQLLLQPSQPLPPSLSLCPPYWPLHWLSLPDRHPARSQNPPKGLGISASRPWVQSTGRENVLSRLAVYSPPVRESFVSDGPKAAPEARAIITTSAPASSSLLIVQSSVVMCI